MRHKSTTEYVYSKKRQIANCATHLFARDGFAKTKISDIARKAKTSVGALYLYFDSKEDILAFIFEDTWRELNRQIDKNRNPAVDSRKQLEDVACLCIDFFYNRRDLARVVIRETCPLGKREEYKRFIGVIDLLIKRAKKEHSIDARINNEILRHATYGAVENILFGWCQGATYTPNDAKQLMAAIFKGVAPFSKF